MRKKIWISSIGITLILILTFFPTTSSTSFKLNIKNSMIDLNEIVNMDANTIKIKILHIKEDGSYIKTIKKLTIAENKGLIQELRHIEEKSKTTKEIFEEKLEIFKKYELVSNDLTLDDILDVRKLEGKDGPVPKQFGEEFEALWAPIVFVGGGLGIGFGVPFFITSGTFLVVLLGFGYVYCNDILNGVTHELITLSFFPIVGYLSGFIGLLMLPVVPGFLYSNFFGMGISAYQHWIPFLSYNMTG